MKKFETYSFCVNNEYTASINDFTANINYNNYENEIVKRFKAIFEHYKFDYIIILGDRIEIALIALLAKQQEVKIIHLGGGETSLGSNDNEYRYCISRLADYHLVISKLSRLNLFNVGIKNNVHVVGSTRTDYRFYEKRLTKPQLYHNLHLDIKKEIAVIIIHPEKTELKYDKLFQSFKSMNYNIVFISANYDRGYEKINNKIVECGFKIFFNLDIQVWYSLLYHCKMIIGNSSSLINEAPLYKCKIELIGNRQDGREHTPIETTNISVKIVKLLKDIL